MPREVVLHGKAIAVKENGKVKVTTYPTPRAARVAYQKLTADDAPKAAADNEELLAQIAKAPDDDALRMVYADWLLANGNPRGELIALQASRDKKLQAKARRLIDRHPEWLGALGDRVKSLSKWEAGKAIRYDWRLGFLDRIELRSNAVDADLVAELAKLPSARLVRELVLGGTDNYRKVVTVLRKTGWPACVEKLSIGHQRWGEYLPTTNHCGDIVAALANYPRLVELDLTPGSSKLAGVSSPALRRLALRECQEHHLAAVAATKWPDLERLALRLIDSYHITFAVHAKWNAPKLRELELHLWRDDQLQIALAHLPKAKLLRGVERLCVVAEKRYVDQIAAAMPELVVETVEDAADK